MTPNDESQPSEDERAKPRPSIADLQAQYSKPLPEQPMLYNPNAYNAPYDPTPPPDRTWMAIMGGIFIVLGLVFFVLNLFITITPSASDPLAGDSSYQNGLQIGQWVVGGCVFLLFAIPGVILVMLERRSRRRGGAR